MNLAVSNIAWRPQDDEAVAQMLQQERVFAIDVAPSRDLQKPSETSEDEARSFRRRWSRHDIALVGMQSLAYGTTGLELFGSQSAREELFSHLSAMSRLGAMLGIERLTFGSPKQRDRGLLANKEAIDIAMPFFRALGERCEQDQTRLCVEPVAKAYGGNFLTTTAETAQFVRAVDHPHVQLQIDSGAMALAAEDPETTLHQHHDLVGHVHLSEPGMKPFGDGESAHISVVGALQRHCPTLVNTIEMMTPENESPVDAIRRAIQAVRRARKAQLV